MNVVHICVAALERMLAAGVVDANEKRFTARSLAVLWLLEMLKLRLGGLLLVLGYLLLVLIGHLGRVCHCVDFTGLRRGDAGDTWQVFMQAQCKLLAE